MKKETPRHTFSWQGEQFLLDGLPFVLRCAEMHYPRIPRAYWRDRLRKAKAMGLNTLCTYVFWNLHEPEPGRFDFRDNLDVAAFVRMAQEEGLWVLLRPGPYICTEWEWGGFPPWLFRTPDIRVRSADPRFLKAAAAYMQQVGRELAHLQIMHGGPILMVQVENEYGSFGSDKTYMNAVRQMIRDAGFDVPLYTSDGPSEQMLSGGTLPDTLAAINFSGDPAAEFASFARFRQGVPRFCGEYWIGWFDHWGEPHHTTPPAESAQGVDWMLANGISFSLYMFHGGTTFGFMNGANFGAAYEPDTSSYDYDSPLDEAGRPTSKFFALRDVIRKHLPAGTTLPDLPASLSVISIPRFTLSESASLPDSLETLSRPIPSERPQPMEALGQSYGFILYRKQLDKAARGTLTLSDLHDYALLYQGRKRLGALDRRRGQSSLDVTLDASAPLDILVENMGRINFGPRLVDDRKGITEQVTLDGREMIGWEIYPLPLADLSHLVYTPEPKRGPAFYRGHFSLETLGDTFLDMRGWGKGLVWVNGHNLGRYWHIGPQQTLFLPAPWLKKGPNEIVVLDLEEGGAHSVEGVPNTIFAHAEKAM